MEWDNFTMVKVALFIVVKSKVEILFSFYLKKVCGLINDDLFIFFSRLARVAEKADSQHFKGLERDGRLEFFPIEWRTKLKLDEGKIWLSYF